MANPIVLIPARMSSTRLPGKPLADIHGAPMIVHVWRRAMEADVGPVWVAADDERVIEAVAAAGGKAVMTRLDHPSGSDRIFEALGAVDAEGAHDVVVNVQGDLPTIEASVVRACLAPLADDAVDIATLATPIRREQEKDDPNVVKAVGDRTQSDAPASALFHPRAGAVGRGPPPAPHRPLRLSPRGSAGNLSPPLLRRWSGARNSSNCGRSRRGCGSTSPSSTRRRSASTRPRIWNARAACSRQGNRHDQYAFDRLSGRTRGQLAYRLRRQLSRPDSAALRDVRGRLSRPYRTGRPNSA